MKTQIYYLADTPPPSFTEQISTAAEQGTVWGSTVGVGIFGILCALSIAAYLFKK